MNVPPDLSEGVPLGASLLSLPTLLGTALGALLGYLLAQWVRTRAARKRRVAPPALEHGELDAAQQAWIRNIQQLSDRRVGAIMTPRADVVALAADLDLAEAIKTISLSGYSRFPVYEKRPEQIVGILHAKDALLALSEHPDEVARLCVAALMRPALPVPETFRALALLRELQSGRQQMAIVVDEFGEAAGVVTLEDLIEEIVGDIKDEHDDQDDLGVVMIEPARSLEAAGSTRIQTVNELLGTDLPAGDTQQTIAGFLATELGRIPRPGESIVTHGMGIRVLRGNARRVARLRLETLRGSTKGEAG